MLTVEDWVEGYRRAWVDKDAAAAAALFTEDAEYRSNIFEDPHRGREGVHAYWSGVTAEQEDVEVAMGRPFVDGKRIAVEFWTTMRSGGAPITLPGCLLLEMDDSGLCRRLREYWHVGEGVTAPPPEWGS